MPNPVFSDVHIQAALTQVSVAFIQDESHYIADRVFPIVPVVHQADKYFIWNKGDFFRDQAQMRADATESAISARGLALVRGDVAAGQRSRRDPGRPRNGRPIYVCPARRRLPGVARLAASRLRRVSPKE